MNWNQLLSMDPALVALGLAGLGLLFSLVALISARRCFRQQSASENTSLARQVERIRSVIDGLNQGLSSCQEGIKALREENSEDRSQMAALARKLDKLAQDTSLHLQRVGLVRFNAFSEAGGALSFALALLDEHGSGVVILTLHNRDDCRTFIRQVRQGVSEQRLTAEEKQAIQEALGATS